MRAARGRIAQLALVVLAGCMGGDDDDEICGNGRDKPWRDPVNGSYYGKGCDDGNTRNGDGCSSLCSIESGWMCPTFGQPCVPRCGDGTLLADEICEPALPVDGYYCDQCRTLVPGRCGDGQITAPFEECEDGNTVAYDGCTSCQIDFGFECNVSSVPVICSASGLAADRRLDNLGSAELRQYCEWLAETLGGVGNSESCGSFTVFVHTVDECVSGLVANIAGGLLEGPACTVGFAESLVAEGGSLCGFWELRSRSC